jgi:hypothetical protein
VRRNRFKLFEIPTGQQVIRIQLNDGGMCVYDREGESYFDGWATVEDIASGLVEWALLSPEEAESVAAEAVRRWEAWLGERHHRYPRMPN